MALLSDRLLHAVARNSLASLDASDAPARSRVATWLPPSSVALSASRKEVRWSCENTGRAMPRLVAARSAIAEAPLAPSTQRLSAKFAELKEAKKIAFIPYVVAGDPDLDTTSKALLLLDAEGADILEVGVPYTDPLADGPVIQDASTRALERGVTLDAVLEMLKKVSPQLKAPVVLFTYYNPIIKRGIEKFLSSIKEAGASGLLVPDLVLEDTEELRVLTEKYGLELVLLTTPTTPVTRMKAIAGATQGFLYLVSLTGVTGARDAVSARVQYLLKEIKQASNTPVAVGFGISSPQQAVQIVGWGADGVIIGSAIVKLLGAAASPEEGLAVVKAFAQSIRSAV